MSNKLKKQGGGVTKYGVLPLGWRSRIDAVRAEVGEPPYLEIGDIHTFDDVFLFDRAQEDAGYRYYMRDGVEQERRELGVELPGTLVVSVTVLGRGVRVRQPGWVALSGRTP